MDVTIFTECPVPAYFRSLEYLHQQKKIRLQCIDSRFFYLFFLKIYSTFFFLRLFGYRYFGKPLHVEKKVSWSDIRRSFFSYFVLPFTKKNLVVLFAPYSYMGIYLWFLKLCRRKIIYMSSWPYWDGSHFVFSPNALKLFFWKRFLYGIPAVGISEHTVQALCSYTKNIVHIPHAVDTSLYIPGKKSSSFTALYVGRLVEEKGIRGLLDLARELPQIQFFFVGSGPLQVLFDSNDLKNVHYLGHIHDTEKIVSLYQFAHVFLLNSYRVKGWEELYGLVLLESFSCGLPVIATDCVGPSEIVENGKTGYLVPQQNLDAFEEKLLDLYHHPRKIERFGKAARKEARVHYDIQSLSEQWHSVLNSVNLLQELL